MRFFLSRLRFMWKFYRIRRDLDSSLEDLIRYLDVLDVRNVRRRDSSLDSFLYEFSMLCSVCILLLSLWSDFRLLDDLSKNLVYLTCILIPICLLCDRSYNSVNSLIYVILECVILGVFKCDDMLQFFIQFEGVLIPMFILLGVLGKGFRRSRAGIRLLLYTILGSIWFLLGILVSIIECGSLEFELMSILDMDNDVRSLIWCLVFLGMMVKIPLMPVHIWLGEAHVEASTGGSVLLAGVLLKLGGYGLMRFNMFILGGSGESFMEIVNMVCILGIIMSGIMSIRQTDMKRVIAYGSISHMSLLVLGILSGVYEGLLGGVIQMLSHGIVSSGLFLSSGIIYNRIGSREISYISGLLEVMPFFGLLFNMCILGNIGLPGTSSFVGELFSLMGIIKENWVNGLFSSSSMVIGVCYSLWLFNRSMFGGLCRFRDIDDLKLGESMGLIVLVFLMITIGIFPSIIRFNV